MGQRPGGHAVREATESSPFKLQNVETGILVSQVHHPIAIDEAVARLNDLRPVRARIHHARRIRRDVVGDLVRLKLVCDIEDTDAGIVIGRENKARTLECAGPVFVQIMRAEEAAFGAIIHFARHRECRDAHWIGGLSHIVHPDVAQSILAVGGIRLIGNDEQLAVRQR